MNPIRQIACFAALTCLPLAGHALADLSPGSGLVGAGNIRGGMAVPFDPGAFYLDHSFYLRWQDTSVTPSARFSDLIGNVGSVWQSPSTGLAPYVFTGIELYATESQSLLQRQSFGAGSSQLGFTFSRLLEGAYQIRFIGRSVEPPPGDWWPVNEWQYSFSAIASPAPEASGLAMSALGLVAVGMWARRHQRAPRPVA